ncbi:MAG: hypothetical protein IJB92_06780, partial [Clostridia bacterium]|nr:hypothetical protein [Clostridia bacterium]
TGRDIVLDRIDKILDGEDLRDPAVAQRMGKKPKTEEETAADEAKKAETMAPAPVQSIKEPQPAAKPKAEARPAAKQAPKQIKKESRPIKKTAAKPQPKGSRNNDKKTVKPAGKTDSFSKKISSKGQNKKYASKKTSGVGKPNSVKK